AIGEETEETDLLTYVENIRNLLNQVKVKYAEGDKDAALSLATKAYLDNFEFLESTLKEAGQDELTQEMETMMRVELRDMISNDASPSEVNSKVDIILENMEIVKIAVPEFGAVVIVTLTVAIIGIVIITNKIRLNPIPQL
ncbi:MAG: PEFG-CTERM sorting domain-containing protein, partial [Nitrosarchaeum sp.]